MPSTYTPIVTVTLGSAVSSYTFSSIPSTYTDLVMVLNGRSAASATSDTYIMQFNGDTGLNYSRTRLLGTGSAASSANRTNGNTIDYEGMAANTGASGVYGYAMVNVQNYSNSTTRKTVLIRNGDVNYVEATVGLWQNTSAISSINLATASGSNLMAGSTFTLYGVKSA